MPVAGFIELTEPILEPDQLDAVESACDRHMALWGPRGTPDQPFPINFYSNRYIPLHGDPALRALPTHPAVLPCVVQLLRSCDISLSRAQLTYKYPQKVRPTFSCAHRHTGSVLSTRLPMTTCVSSSIYRPGERRCAASNLSRRRWQEHEELA